MAVKLMATQRSPAGQSATVVQSCTCMAVQAVAQFVELTCPNLVAVAQHISPAAQLSLPEHMTSIPPSGQVAAHVCMPFRLTQQDSPTAHTVLPPHATPTSPSRAAPASLGPPLLLLEPLLLLDPPLLLLDPPLLLVDPPLLLVDPPLLLELDDAPPLELLLLLEVVPSSPLLPLLPLPASAPPPSPPPLLLGVVDPPHAPMTPRAAPTERAKTTLAVFIGSYPPIKLRQKTESRDERLRACGCNYSVLFLTGQSGFSLRIVFPFRCTVADVPVVWALKGQLRTAGLCHALRQ
jgi:hypothetical protein